MPNYSSNSITSDEASSAVAAAAAAAAAAVAAAAAAGNHAIVCGKRPCLPTTVEPAGGGLTAMKMDKMEAQENRNAEKNAHVAAKNAEKNPPSADAANITELPEKRKDAVKNAQDAAARIKVKNS